MIKKVSKGITIMELLIYTSIVFILFSLSIISFKSFNRESEITNAVRTVIASFNTARYEAVSRFYNVKVYQNDNEIWLEKKINGIWKRYKTFEIKGDEIEFDFNNSPVFSPLGSVSPLCSVFVKNNFKNYKISISMAGRIKTVKIDE